MIRFLTILMLIFAPSFASAEISSWSGSVRPPTTTVAGLPTCNSGAIGRTYMVTDALVPVALATVAGGGSVVVKVTCDGSLWKVM